MKKTFMMMTAVLALLAVAPVDVQAQTYEGVVAGDDGAGGTEEPDLYNPNRQYSDEIYSPDWARLKAERENAAYRASIESLSAYRAAAAEARAAEGEQIQEQIDARVDAAVSGANDYAGRIDALKAPPPQLPPDQQPVVVTPETQPGTGDTGTTDTLRDRDGVINRDGSVLDRMMNALQ